MTEWLIPPPLTSGAVVRVVAPSGPFDPALVWRGLGWLSERYRVRFDRGIFAAAGYLVGSDARRQAELAAALIEPCRPKNVQAGGVTPGTQPREWRRSP